MLDFVEENKVL